MLLKFEKVIERVLKKESNTLLLIEFWKLAYDDMSNKMYFTAHY